jgi:hypothetical protein
LELGMATTRKAGADFALPKLKLIKFGYPHTHPHFKRGSKVEPQTHIQRDSGIPNGFRVSMSPLPASSPSFKTGENPNLNPVNSGFPRQNGDGTDEYSRVWVLLQCLIGIIKQIKHILSPNHSTLLKLKMSQFINYEPTHDAES